MDDLTKPLGQFKAGAKVNQYLIDHRIGQGGMGEVYLAFDTILERKVALKFMLPELAKNPELVKRFENEARSAARLNHPNVVSVFEVARYDQQAFIAMEYVEGDTLKSILKRRRLSTEEVKDYTIQICQALYEAHSKGIIHRDIKPANIIIDHAGRLRLLDFWLAKIRKGSSDSFSQSGAMIGTLDYMSPEQIRGEVIDHRSDIFSLGALIYELLFGRPPFAAKNDVGVIQSILEKTPEFPSRNVDSSSSALADIAATALQKDSAQRQQSISEILVKLKGAANSGEMQDKAKGSPLRSTKSLVLGTISLFILLYLSYSIYRGSSQSPIATTVIAAENEADTIVVQPFKNQTGDNEDEYLAFAITRGMSSRLKYNTNLVLRENDDPVASAVSSTTISTGGARFVVSGSLRRATEQYVVECDVKTFDAKPDELHFSLPFDSPDDFNEVQDRLFEALLSKLGLDERGTIIDPLGGDELQPQTQTLIQKGMHLLSIDQAETAIELFKMAKAREPERFVIDYYLGLAYEELGKYQNAIDHYKLSLAECDDSQVLKSMFGNDDLFSRTISNFGKYEQDTVVVEQRLSDGTRLLSAVNLTTLETIWSTKLGRHCSAVLSRGRRTNYTSSGTKSSGNDTLIGIDPITGATLWQVPDTNMWGRNFSRMNWNPNIDDLNIEGSDNFDRRWVFDLKTGKVLLEWTDSLTGQFGEIFQINCLGSRLLISTHVSNTQHFLIWNLDNSNLEWQADSLFRIDLISDDGSIVAENQSNLGLFSIESQKFIWEFDYPKHIKPAPDPGSKPLFTTSPLGLTNEYIIVRDSRPSASNSEFAAPTDQVHLRALRMDKSFWQGRQKWGLSFEYSIALADYRTTRTSLPDKVWLKNSGADSIVLLVDIEKGEILWSLDVTSLRKEADSISGSLTSNSLGYLASGDSLFISTNRRLILCDAPNKRVKTLLHASIPLWSLLNSDCKLRGNFAICQDRNANKISLYDLESGNLLANVPRAEFEYVEELAVNNAGKPIIATTRNVFSFEPRNQLSHFVRGSDVRSHLALCNYRIGNHSEANKIAREVIENYDATDSRAAAARLLSDIAILDSSALSSSLSAQWQILRENGRYAQEVIEGLKLRFGLDWQVNSDEFGFALISSGDEDYIAAYGSSLRNDRILVLDRNYGVDSGHGTAIDFRSQSDYSKGICSRPGGWVILEARYDSTLIKLASPTGGVESSMLVGLTNRRSRVTLASRTIGTKTFFLFAEWDGDTCAANLLTYDLETQQPLVTDQSLPRGSWNAIVNNPWAFAGGYAIRKMCGDPRYYQSDADSFVVFPISSLDNDFSLVPDEPMASAEYDGDLVAATSRPDRYFVWNLDTRAVVFDYRYPDTANFHPSIGFFADETIIDWDNKQVFALDIRRNGSSSPFRWRTPLSSLPSVSSLSGRFYRHEDRLFLETEDERLIILSFLTGKYLGQVKLLWPANDFVADNDRVYVAAGSQVYAVKYKI